MAKKFGHFCPRSSEFLLPNDQFSPELGGLDRGEVVENIERHPGHSNEKKRGSAV